MTLRHPSDVLFAGEKPFPVLPVLDHYNMESLISTDKWLPLPYLIWTAIYSLIYCSVAMLVAIWLIQMLVGERRLGRRPGTAPAVMPLGRTAA